jgi:predicted house-cleaning noncanonical NTP pyrophosphatase (MazG superfamily)
MSAERRVRHKQLVERRRLVKLVRGSVEQFLGGDVRVKYEVIRDRRTYIKSLRRKIAEESIEYIEDPCLDELADILEVAQTLAAEDLGVAWAQVEAAARAKRIERGGYSEGIGMYLNVAGEHADPQAEPTQPAPGRPGNAPSDYICSECGGRGGLHWDNCSHRNEAINAPEAERVALEWWNGYMGRKVVRQIGRVVDELFELARLVVRWANPL